MRGELEVLTSSARATQADTTWEIVSTIQAQFPDFYLEDMVAHWGQIMISLQSLRSLYARRGR